MPLLVALILAGGLACGGGSGSGGSPRNHDDKPWNVLLVTFDTTRADHIGCYGRERASTPTLDGLAEDGVRFAEAMAAVPITAPSHTTVLTGRYPIAHGVRDNGLFVLADEQVTLAEILGREGYATAAAIGAYPLTAQFGLDQGFDLFDDHLTGLYEDHHGVRTVAKERLFFDERRAAQVNEAILPWLEERAADPPEQPFFAWVHYFDPHQPFEPAPPYDQLFADSLYDGEIAYADSRLGFLLQRLEDLGELDRTLVVMTADHGEGLGEHNEDTHAILAYNSTLHVPLLIRPPGDFRARGTVVEERVSTVNVMPTILDLLDIELPEGVQGHSLAPYWTEGRRPARWSRVQYAENLSPRMTHGWGELRVLFEGPLKYIHGPEPQLFDLDADPEELDDLAAERPAEAREMRRNLEAFLRRWSVAGASSSQPVDEEVRRRLESLGYLQSTGEGPGVVVERLRQDGPAPRQRVHLINDLSAAKQLLFQRRGRQALVYTQRLLDSNPDNPLYLELRILSLLQSGQMDLAWQLGGEVAKAGKLNDDVTLDLATRRAAAGDPAGAREFLRRQLGEPDSARGAWVLSLLSRELEDSPAARESLNRALDIDPTFAPARLDLAVALAEAGETGAEGQFQRTLRDAPYYSQAHYNYGTYLLHQGRYTDATARFERALALRRDYLPPRLALVATHLAAGRRDDAEAAYDALREAAPESREAARAAELLAAP